MNKKLTGALIALLLVATFQFAVVSAEQEQPVRARQPEQVRVQVEEARERSKNSRNQAQERVQEIKQEASERRLSVKQDVCSRRQAQLEKIVPKLSNSSTRVKGTIDKVYERVQGFYETGQLNVENYDELELVVEERKAAAEVSISAIESAVIEYDCENPSFGQQLDSYRLLVAESRESLKSYRNALVELISAMRSASQSSDQVEDTNNPESEVENE